MQLKLYMPQCQLLIKRDSYGHNVNKHNRVAFIYKLWASLKRNSGSRQADHL
jgi:hypothetical protein